MTTSVSTGWLSAMALFATLAACSHPVGAARDATSDNTTSAMVASAFSETSPHRCSPEQISPELELMAWDSRSRANVARLSTQGLVAVRYSGDCNDLEVLSNCHVIGSYAYNGYSAEEHKVIHDVTQLYAQLPIGAARLAGELTSDKILRTDYILVGSLSDSSPNDDQDEMEGSDCNSATHIVSALYIGGFALALGDASDISAQGSLFGGGLGMKNEHEYSVFVSEGNRGRCESSLATGQWEAGCMVPLRMTLRRVVHESPQVVEQCGANQDMINDRCRPVESECDEGKHWSRIRARCESAMMLEYDSIDSDLNANLNYSAGHMQYSGTATGVMMRYKDDVQRSTQYIDSLFNVVRQLSLHSEQALVYLRIGMVYRDLWTALFSVRPPSLQLFTEYQEEMLRQADESGNPDLEATATNVRFRIMSGWRVARDRELNMAAELSVTKFYISYIVASFGRDAELMERAIYELAAFERAISSDAMAGIMAQVVAQVSQDQNGIHYTSLASGYEAGMFSSMNCASGTIWNDRQRLCVPRRN